MSPQPKQSTAPEELEQTISEYLKAHPDFFELRPDLLHALELPHQSGEAVSLIERQVKSLRDESLNCKQQLDQLFRVARENEQLNRRLHRSLLRFSPEITANKALTAKFGSNEPFLNSVLLRH